MLLHAWSYDCYPLNNSDVIYQNTLLYQKLWFGFPIFFTLQLLLSQTTDDIDKANLLNDYFRDQTLINENNAFLPILPPFNGSPLRDIIVTPAEVQIILKPLPVDTATGSD